MPNNVINIYTDGACSGNPGPGGFGFLILNNNEGIAVSEYFPDTTNNRMELLAVITALDMAGTMPCAKTTTMVITTDSKYVVDAINQGWLKKWQINGWRTANKNPVANKDLWLKLIEHLRILNLQFKWVKGHSTNQFNNHCDKLATTAIMRKAGSVEAYKA